MQSFQLQIWQVLQPDGAVKTTWPGPSWWHCQWPRPVTPPQPWCPPPCPSSCSSRAGLGHPKPSCTPHLLKIKRNSCTWSWRLRQIFEQGWLSSLPEHIQHEQGWIVIDKESNLECDGRRPEMEKKQLLVRRFAQGMVTEIFPVTT